MRPALPRRPGGRAGGAGTRRTQPMHADGARLPGKSGGGAWDALRRRGRLQPLDRRGCIV